MNDKLDLMFSYKSELSCVWSHWNGMSMPWHSFKKCFRTWTTANHTKDCRCVLCFRCNVFGVKQVL